MECPREMCDTSLSCQEASAVMAKSFVLKWSTTIFRLKVKQFLVQLLKSSLPKEKIASNRERRFENETERMFL